MANSFLILIMIITMILSNRNGKTNNRSGNATNNSGTDSNTNVSSCQAKLYMEILRRVSLSLYTYTCVYIYIYIYIYNNGIYYTIML